MKVLIVSHNSFSQTHNNGKTLSSLFSSFNKDELCQLYFSPIGKVDRSRCNNYYLIRDIDALKSLNFFNRRCGSTEVEDAKELPDSVRHGHHWIILLLRSLVWKLSSWYSGGLNKWLSEQKPNIIFYVGGESLFSHWIARSLSDKLNIPLLAYFTDDYIIYPPQTVYTKVLKKCFKKTIECSKAVYVIGTQMAEEYSKYFGSQFRPIMNITDVPPMEPKYDRRENVISINYFGGIGWARDKELLRFAIYFRQKIEPLLSKDVKIGIYTFGTISEDIKEKLNKNGVDIFNGLKGNDLTLAMSNTDVFLHVESVEPDYRASTKLAVSTKIPEYMGLAKPIIAFGPADVASFKVISQANSTLVIDDRPGLNDDFALQKSISETLSDENKVKQISHDNYVYALKNFNKPVIANNFKNDLSKFVISDNDVDDHD